MSNPVMESAITSEPAKTSLTSVAEPGQVSLSGESIPRAEKIAQAVVLTFVLAMPAVICVHGAAAADPDVWWHLRTAEWILQHHAVPQVDSFSSTAAGKPWQAYSWLFEVLVYKIFQRFGLVGLVGYSSGMVLAITVAIRHLVRRMQSDFIYGAMLTFIACFLMSRVYTPRPWLFSILLLVLEADVVMVARKTGRARELLWLPVIFALWGNTHIQFIYGLAILGWAAVEAAIPRRFGGSQANLRPGWLFAALAGSAVAVCANPYGWRIYQIVYDIARQPGGLNNISELQALPFRQLTDYGLLFLALVTTAVLAWERRFRLFESGLLVFAVVVSFRSQRDVWVLATLAVAILASVIPGRETEQARYPAPGWSTVLATVVACCLVWAGFRLLGVNNKALEPQMVKILPVEAVNDIQAKGYAGPLYNTFDWGGYLIWALRMPVSIDGRGSFYGDDAINRSVRTWDAEPDWSTDPALKSAGLVIGPAQSPLTQVLRLDSHFQLVHEDKLAAVFVARK